MNKTLVLASASPRRKQLLEQVGLDFLVDAAPGSIELLPDRADGGQDLALKNASLKAHAIAKNHETALVLGADTVVYLGEQIFEKPKDRADAIRILSFLQGKTHHVVTGLSLLNSETGEEQTSQEVTMVRFAPLDRMAIEYYVDHEEVLDKAGAYAIQGLGALFVEAIEGDYFNIMGLPLHRLRLMLARFDINLLNL